MFMLQWNACIFSRSGANILHLVSTYEYELLGWKLHFTKKIAKQNNYTQKKKARITYKSGWNSFNNNFAINFADELHRMNNEHMWVQKERKRKKEFGLHESLQYCKSKSTIQGIK